MFEIDEVLSTTGGAFVPDQIGQRQDRDGHSIVGRYDTLWPRVVELHAVDLGDNVDAIGRYADLKDHSGCREISLGQVCDRVRNAGMKGLGQALCRSTVTGIGGSCSTDPKRISDGQDTLHNQSVLHVLGPQHRTLRLERSGDDRAIVD